MGPAGGIVAALESTPRVGIDTPVFIYHIEQSSSPAIAATDLLRAVEDGRFEGITSIITLLEVTIRPLRLGCPEIADAYEALLGDIPNLAIVGMDANVARIVAQLRATHRLQTPDALQIAACLAHGSEAFITNDRRLRRVTELDVKVLEDFS